MAQLLVAMTPADLATPERKIAREQARSEDLFQRCIPGALLSLPGASCGDAAAAPRPPRALSPSLRDFTDEEGGCGASHYRGDRIHVCQYELRQCIHECWALPCIFSVWHRLLAGCTHLVHS